MNTDKWLQMQSVGLRTVGWLLVWAWPVLFGGTLFAETIRGRVMDAAGETIYIATDSEWLPSVGDPVEITFDQPGGASATKVATGKLVQTGDKIVAKMDAFFMQVERGHLATITSANPQRKTAAVASGATANTRIHGERARRWKSLFDGSTLDGWVINPGSAEDAWKVEGGCIVGVGEPGVVRRKRGYLGTKAQFGNFELAFQWKVSAKGNGGIHYRLPGGVKILTSPQYQIIDAAATSDAKTPETIAGALWAVMGPQSDVARPVGEFNDGRIVCRGTHIEHWLNGVKVVDCDTSSDAWATASRTMTTRYPGFCTSPRGMIYLENLCPTIWYRNIKIRPL